MKAKMIADYMNQYIANDKIDCADKLTELRFNPKLENEIEEEQWDYLIDYVYQNLLAHSMEDGVISDIERTELNKLMNLKAEFRNTTKEAIQYRLTNSIQTVEKSHEHLYAALKPSPWDNQSKNNK